MPQKKIKYAPVAIDDMDEIFSCISSDLSACPPSLYHINVVGTDTFAKCHSI